MTSSETAPHRVFITGASGFIGKALAAHYRARGVETLGVDLTAAPEEGVFAGDIAAPEAWAERLDGVDILYHTAAVVSFTAPARRTWEVNVRATQRLLRQAAARRVKRFALFSSVAAMGFDYPDGADETWPLRPNGNPYVDTKIASEHAVLAAHASGAIEATVIRPGDVYGPLSRPWIHAPLDVMRGRQFILPAGGRGLLTPIHIDDLITGSVLAAERPEGAGQIFILTAGVAVATGRYFAHHWRWLGKSGAPPTAPTRLARGAARLSGGAARLLGRRSEVGAHTVDWLTRSGGYSIDKARQRLGFSPGMDLEEGLRGCEAHLRERGAIP